MPYIYILRCSDGLYYTGLTVNLRNRMAEHAAGKSKFTQSRLPVELVYSEFIVDEKAAVKREKQIKDWSRAKKEALINKTEAVLPQLAKKKFMRISK